jgi:hypothetical protein
MGHSAALLNKAIVVMLVILNRLSLKNYVTLLTTNS